VSRPTIRSAASAVVLAAGLTLTLTFTLLATPARADRAAAETAAAARVAGPVVLIGTGGLRWDDVGDSTPALFALLGGGATGTLAVRSVGLSTCPVDGWLAVSAGRRAADAPIPTGEPACRTPLATVTSPGGPGQVTGWQTYRAQAAAGTFDATPGLLGDTLTAAGRTCAAIGPGALIAVADNQGSVAHSWLGLPAGPDGSLDPNGDGLALLNQVTAALATRPDLLTIDLGAIRDPLTDKVTDDSTSASRADQVAALDTRLGLVLDALPAQASVIVASLADSSTDTHLQLVAAHGPDVAPSAAFSSGLLRTGSTRQPGVVQATDLLPALVTLLGVPEPAAAVGSPLTRIPAGDDVSRLQRLLDLDQGAHLLDPLVTPFFIGYGALQLIAYLWLGGFARRLGRPSVLRQAPVLRRRALTLLRHSAIAFSLVPAATFLANAWPWWRAGSPGLVLTLAVVTATVPLALIAVGGPWRRTLLGPAGVAGGLTAAVLTLDLATGSRLSLTTLMGGQPIIGGRFYGLSNPGFALFGTGALFAALALADLVLRRGGSRIRAGLAVAGAGLVATVIDGLPRLGSDFGGPPAIIPAFALLALWVAGVRVTWRRSLLIAAVTVAAIVALSVLDWLRPASDRTHLGRFVQSVLDGGGGLIVRRKALQNLDQLISTPLTLTLPLLAVALVFVLRRPGRWRLPALQRAYDRQPLLPAGLAAVGVLLLIGFAANDSGTSIPPVALTVLAPLLVAIGARSVELDDADRADAALAASLRPVKPHPRAGR
jgi:hypothetical protein